MAEPNLQELNESIQLLSNYRDRLHKEVSTIAKKLQMPPGKINSVLKDNSELANINKSIVYLISQRERQLRQDNP